MKAFLIAAFVATIALSGFTSKAEAGNRHYTICWMQTSGMTACRSLPRNYSIPGVAKPRPRGAAVSFALTRMRIACLRPFVNTDGMRPGQAATIYAPKR